MNPESKFNAFFSCVIGDPSLKTFLEDLIDSNILSVIYPPVKLKLVFTNEVLMVKVTDGINSYLMKPIDIDDNILQDMAQAYSKYKPEDSESEPESEDEFRSRLGLFKRNNV